MTDIPDWALSELQEELEDAAVDYGVKLAESDGSEPDMWGAAFRFNDASEKLRRAIALAVESK